MAGVPAASHAQAKKQKLFDAFKKAAYVLYEEQKYEDAIVQFEKAYEVIPDPKIWFNLGQCHRQLHHVEQALLYYEKFLDALPGISDIPDAKKRSLETEVREWVSQLRRQKEEEDARLREEEARRQKEQSANAAGQGGSESGGEKASDKGGDLPPSKTEPGAQGNASLTSRWWFWTGVGTTAVLAGVTVWAGLQSRDYNDKWQQIWDTEYRDKARLYQNITDAALAGALVSAVVTGVASWMFLRDGQSGSSASAGKSAFLVPVCDGAACTLHLTFSF